MELGLDKNALVERAPLELTDDDLEAEGVRLVSYRRRRSTGDGRRSISESVSGDFRFLNGLLGSGAWLSGGSSSRL